MRREPALRPGGDGAIAAAPLPAFAAAWSSSMTIQLRPSEPGVEGDLASFMRRHGCRAEAAEDGSVIVELPHDIHEQQARMELGLYVRLWQALHGVTVRVELID
jgi:hypothetical protein